MDKEIQTFGRQEQLFAGNGESTDLALMVDALAQEERSPWDASRIRDALMVEAGTDPATAESIALEVEEDLLKYGRTKVTTSIIREMVNVKLFQRGLDAKLADHSRIGLPVHDLETMMFNKNKENSNTSHNPESINLSIAEMVLKEYALTKVFSRDVADAHLPRQLAREGLAVLLGHQDHLANHKADDVVLEHDDEDKDHEAEPHVAQAVLDARRERSADDELHELDQDLAAVEGGHREQVHEAEGHGDRRSEHHEGVGA